MNFNCFLQLRFGSHESLISKLDATDPTGSPPFVAIAVLVLLRFVIAGAVSRNVSTRSRRMRNKTKSINDNQDFKAI